MNPFKGKSLGEIHYTLLCAVGVVYAFQSAQWAWNIVKRLGYLDDPVGAAIPLAMLALSCLLPLTLAMRPLMPQAILAPSRWLHLPVVIGAVLLFGASGEFLVVRQGVMAGLPVEAFQPRTPPFLAIMGIASTVGTVVTAIRLIRSGGAGGITAVTSDTAPQPRATGATSTTLEKTHLICLRLAGVAIFGATIYGAATQPNALMFQVVSAVLGLGAAVVCLSPRWTPQVLARPHRWYHFFVWTFLSSLLLFCALLPYVFGVYGSIISDAAVASEGGLSTAPGEIAALTRAALTTGSGLLAYVAVSVPLTLAWITMIALLFQKPTMVTQPAKLQPHTDPRHVETPPEERKPDMSKGKLPEPKLPSIGAAMKLYIAADWIVMRLLGAGLLWTGYVLWQLIEAERWSRVAALSYGQNPMHALYAYAGIGALMATPFLLPRFITAPRHVAGGLLKAMLLVGSALVLLPMLHVAIELYTPDLYWATLHATVPSVFKGVAAVAVTSALLISFFRQLGSTPKVDYSGKPVMILSGQQLKDLRDARANR